jgi:hypothetical protein
MINVTITESKTGRPVAVYPLNIRGMNYTPSENDYIEAAWESAVADKMVDAERKSDYSFELKEASPRFSHG